MSIRTMRARVSLPDDPIAHRAKPGFSSFKTSVPIAFGCRWHLDALIDATLNPSIVCIEPCPPSAIADKSEHMAVLMHRVGSIEVARCRRYCGHSGALRRCRRSGQRPCRTRQPARRTDWGRYRKLGANGEGRGAAGRAGVFHRRHRGAGPGSFRQAIAPNPPAHRHLPERAKDCGAGAGVC